MEENEIRTFIDALRNQVVRERLSVPAHWDLIASYLLDILTLQNELILMKLDGIMEGTDKCH